MESDYFDRIVKLLLERSLSLTPTDLEYLSKSYMFGIWFRVLRHPNTPEYIKEYLTIRDYYEKQTQWK